MNDLFDGRPPQNTRSVLVKEKQQGIKNTNYSGNRSNRINNVVYNGELLNPDTITFGWNFDAAGIFFVALIPVIIWFILFVTRCPLGTAVYSNGNTEINTTKLGFYTGVITIIVYILLWIFITVIPRKLTRH